MLTVLEEDYWQITYATGVVLVLPSSEYSFVGCASPTVLLYRPMESVCIAHPSSTTLMWWDSDLAIQDHGPVLPAPFGQPSIAQNPPLKGSQSTTRLKSNFLSESEKGTHHAFRVGFG